MSENKRWRTIKKPIDKILLFFSILLLGQDHARPTNNLRPAIKNHCLNVKRIWYNKYYKDFGIERLIRLSLALLLFVFPGLYIRSLFGKLGLLGRKLGVEFYVILKLLLPILFFKLTLTNYLATAVIVGYLGLETLVYLAALIFLSNEFAAPISYRRSLTSLFINYIEICLDYAVIYSYCNFSNPNFFNSTLTTHLQAIYFSFVTSATVGYGDLYVKNSFGQCLVISQIIVFLVFVALFLNFFASKIQDPTYYNTKVKYPNKWNRTRKST